jgi:pimeloyl-ACP methyl ester carboxylesterase
MILPVQTALVSGHTVRYARIGAGPPLVLLHGYPENLQLWAAVAPRLADRFDVIALDWPGMGSSDPWPGGATPMHMASTLIARLDHFALERAAVIGADMGGQPALVAAARHPDRISHAIVTGSLLQWDAQTSWEIALLRRFRVNQFLLARCPRLIFHRAIQTFLPHDHRLDPAIRDDFWTAFRRDEVRRFIVRMCAGYQGTLPRLVDEYARIIVPTLALWGARDTHFPPEHACRLHDQVRHATIEVIDNGHHWLPLQMPEEFAAIAGRFVRR